MERKEIVPIQFAATQAAAKAKMACRIKWADKEVVVYNGIDKYLLYTLLKEVMKHVD